MVLSSCQAKRLRGARDLHGVRKAVPSLLAERGVSSHESWSFWGTQRSSGGGLYGGSGSARAGWSGHGQAGGDQMV